MPLLETRGAGSAKGFGLTGATAAPVYIEDVFSTTLYSGTNAYRGLFLGVPNLAERGALFWFKARNSAIDNDNKLYDTARMGDGGSFLLGSPSLSSNRADFNNSGANLFVVKNRTDGYVEFGGSGGPNESGVNYVGWTFREQRKFFDVVTYTGNSSQRNLSHNLGSVPGCVMIKCTSRSSNWVVYHRSLGNNTLLYLNTTSPSSGTGAFMGDGTPTDTTFPLAAGFGDSSLDINTTGQSYVMYLFAHNAGGFGLTGTDNVISCGSFTVSGNAATVNLGYEPQWLLIKSAASVSAWDLFDSMRGLQVSGNQPVLNAQSSGAEFGTGSGVGVNVTSTGFATNGYLGNGNHIYIAIRRGPMKTPTTGTSVYSAVTRTGTGAAANVTAGFAPDLLFFSANLSGSSGYAVGWFDRLRGTTRRLVSNTTGGESNYGTDSVTEFGNTAVTLGVDSLSTGINFSGQPSVDWMIGRAPGFFDVVCYTGNGSNTTAYTHNLSVSPELIIAKARSSATNWRVGAQFGATTRIAGNLNTTDSLPSAAYDPGTGTTLWTAAPTATTFTPGLTANQSSTTFVAYLFASCPGVSKVGTYTGNGSSQTIDCGFTGGARFFLVKRTDSTGDWWVYDSARGITAPADPALRLNSTAAEVTSADAVDPTSVGIVVNQETTCNINISSATYIFLAIA